MFYAGYLVVEDRGGEQLRVRQFRGRRLLKRIVRYELDTGDPVYPLDSNTFQIPKTGKALASPVRMSSVPNWTIRQGCPSTPLGGPLSASPIPVSPGETRGPRRLL